jgi:hypothetical protein
MSAKVTYTPGHIDYNCNILQDSGTVNFKNIDYL